MISLANYQNFVPIHNGKNSLVYRAQAIPDNRPVILKVLRANYPTVDQLRRYQQEYHLAHQLNLPNIIKAYGLETWEHTLVIRFEDFGALSLKQWLTQQSQPLSVELFLQVAIAITDALGQLHSQDVIHKDINPANIVINPTTQVLKLIDLGISTQLDRELPSLQPLSLLEGTLAYIAPEQTGRMNRGVDYRADFYALGVTFFELLTGQLPFQSQDPMALVHCHLAQHPPQMSELCVHGSSIIGQIIHKLMAKNAEDRYQHSAGLKHDLEVCWRQWQKKGAIANFEIGQQDTSDDLLIPQKLYGREQDIRILLDTFDRVAQGSSELVFVTGPSGIGKTAIVNEIHKPITRQRGYFIKGKFDQLNRKIPLLAIVQACRNLIEQLFSESSTQLEYWKTEILTAVGQNGQVLVDFIPELEQIIGPQPPVLELSGNAAQNRLSLLFRKFTQVFALPEHPLVFFLDDLQWADLASIELLKTLMDDNSYLLVIGAYRNHEVGATHPLTHVLEAVHRKGIVSNTITLKCLSETDIDQFVADTLRCDTDSVRPLAQLIYQKTQGNPFFSIQFLLSLYGENIIRFNPDEGYWMGNISQIERQSLTDDVVKLMSRQLQKLPSPTQDILKFVACIGAQFDLKTLVTVCELTETQLAEYLWPALKAGLIIPCTQNYTFFQVGNILARPNQSVEINNNVIYRFLHDRVQQSAYSLMPDAKRQKTHLKIGRRLLASVSNPETAVQLLDIINQLNRAEAVIQHPCERQKLARLNLLAAQRSRFNTAYEIALDYSLKGIEFLSKLSWQEQYQLTLELHMIAAETANLACDSKLDNHINTILENATSHLDRSQAYIVRVSSLISQGKLDNAIDMCITVLSELGLQLNKHISKIAALLEVLKVDFNLDFKSIETIRNLPQLSDRRIQICMGLLNTLVSISYLNYPSLFLVVATKMVWLSQKYGNCKYSGIGYGIYGIVLIGVLKRNKKGLEYGRLAVEITEKLGDDSLRSNITFICVSAIQVLNTPLRSLVGDLRKGYELGINAGNFEYATWNSMNSALLLYFAGENLENLSEHIARNRQIAISLNQEVPLAFINRVSQSVSNLVGQSQNPLLFSGDTFDEEDFVENCLKLGQLTGIVTLKIEKLILFYLFGDLEAAYRQIEWVAANIQSVMGQFSNCIFHFYSALTLLAMTSERPIETPKNINGRARYHQNCVQRWAKYGPMNASHKWKLIEAERLQRIGKFELAMEFYDQAIAESKANQYFQEEALANELAAKFYLAWGKVTIARTYMQEARYGYLHWGAAAKVKQLEQRYSELLNLTETKILLSGRTIETTSGDEDDLDLNAMIKFSQAITSETCLEDLLQTVIRIVLENAGAQIGCLLLPTDSTSSELDTFSIAAYGSPGSVTHSLAQPIEQILPVSVLNYVKHTHKHVVLDDATTSERFGHDPYIKDLKSRSILCYPLLNQGKLVSIVYLENNAAIGVFSKGRIEFLKIIGDQAAIALTNAQFYRTKLNYSRTLEQKVADRTAELQRANAELLRLSNLDGLTKIANRRQFDQRLHQEWRRLARVQQSLALILFDVDYFKRFNDSYGHQAGDDCLRKIAAAAKTTLNRDADLLARYGGEEFVAILPNTEQQGAIVIAQQIQQAIRALAIPHQQSLSGDIVSVSLGIASIVPTQTDPPTILIKWADQALYAAKQQGRDRWIVHLS